MDASGFFEVVAGVNYFGAVPKGDVAGDFAVADGVEEKESAFAGDVGLLIDELGFAPPFGDEFGEAGGAGGELAVYPDRLPSVTRREGGVVEKSFVGLMKRDGEADGTGVRLGIIVGGAEFNEAFGRFQAVVLSEVGIARCGKQGSGREKDRKQNAQLKTTYAQVHSEV